MESDSEGSWFDRTFGKNKKDKWSDILGTGSNVLSSILNFVNNRRAIKRMKLPPAPAPLQAAKMKTSYNINPQLDAIREATAANDRMITGNTASSRIALARRQRNRANALLQKNSLYGQKENIENLLINQDRKNRQAVANTNVSNYNQWNILRNSMYNDLIDKYHSNNTDLIMGLNRAVQDLIGRWDARRKDRKDLEFLKAANPKAAETLRGLGIID